MEPGRRVVVPVANPEASTAHVRIAAWIARCDGGSVAPLVVVPSPEHDQAAHTFATAAAGTAAALGVATDPVVVHDTSVARGVLQVLIDRRATLAVMGWRGASTRHNVFGPLIDTITGRSTVPLAVVRPGRHPIRRVLLLLAPDHLRPASERVVALAAHVGRSCAEGAQATFGVLAADLGGDLPPAVAELPAELLEEPGPLDVAVRRTVADGDLLVAPVAPTDTGLREATTHIAWAAPDATLLVVADVGRVAEGAVTAVRNAPVALTELISTPAGEGEVVVDVVVTPREGGGAPSLKAVRTALQSVGSVRAIDRDGGGTVNATVVIRVDDVAAAEQAVTMALSDDETIARSVVHLQARGPR